VALFICTAGEELSRCSQELLKGDHPVLGYILDLMGSMVVESATDELQKQIKQMAQKDELQITNRYSRGYCKWSVADQHKLFSFFPSNCCGIGLTDSSLMHPVKSVSGIIGLGKEVKFREYTCDLCSQVDCFHKDHLKIR
jgi:cobalamin-dependent methionine synthase I